MEPNSYPEDAEDDGAFTQHPPEYTLGGEAKLFVMKFVLARMTLRA